MSPKTTLRIELFSCLVLCILLGAWLVLSFQQWMSGNLTALWIAGTVFFVGAVAFDSYKLLQKFSRLPNNSKVTVPPNPAS
jgi:hypothetical protein